MEIANHSFENPGHNQCAAQRSPSSPEHRPTRCRWTHGCLDLQHLLAVCRVLGQHVAGQTDLAEGRRRAVVGTGTRTYGTRQLVAGLDGPLSHCRGAVVLGQGRRNLSVIWTRKIPLN